MTNTSREFIPSGHESLVSADSISLQVLHTGIQQGNKSFFDAEDFAIVQFDSVVDGLRMRGMYSTQDALASIDVSDAASDGLVAHIEGLPLNESALTPQDLSLAVGGLRRALEVVAFWTDPAIFDSSEVLESSAA